MANRIGIVPFWKSYDRATVLRIAELADDLGYDSIWVPEAWAYEQFQLLTEIATRTKRLKLATGIANVFSRSPGLLAMSVATLDEISEGRAVLGSARAASSSSRTSTGCRTRSRSRGSRTRSTSCARCSPGGGSSPR